MVLSSVPTFLFRPDHAYKVIPCDGVVDLEGFAANRAGRHLNQTRQFLHELWRSAQRHGSLLVYCKQGQQKQQHQDCKSNPLGRTRQIFVPVVLDWIVVSFHVLGPTGPCLNVCGLALAQEQIAAF